MVAVNGLGADVLPGAFVEGPVDVVAVDPRDLGEFAVGKTDPDLAHVVGVVVDLPFPAAAGDGGGLAAVWGEEVRVVGAVVDGDAAGGDGLPAHGEQFEVVAPGQRDGDVSGDGDERGPHLVRCECLPGHHRVAQPFVGPVVVVHQPLIEEVLELGDAVAGVFLGVGAAAGDVGSGVAGQVLAEQGVDGAEGALDDALRGGGAKPGLVLRELAPYLLSRRLDAQPAASPTWCEPGRRLGVPCDVVQGLRTNEPICGLGRVCLPR